MLIQILYYPSNRRPEIRQAIVVYSSPLYPNIVFQIFDLIGGKKDVENLEIFIAMRELISNKTLTLPFIQGPRTPENCWLRTSVSRQLQPFMHLAENYKNSLHKRDEKTKRISRYRGGKMPSG